MYQEPESGRPTHQPLKDLLYTFNNLTISIDQLKTIYADRTKVCYVNNNRNHRTFTNLTYVSG